MRIHNIVQAHEIALVFSQFSHRFLLARPIFCDACSLLKKYTAILGTTVKDVIQSILSDDAHAVVPDPRICKELIDVLDAAARVIQIYFTVTVSIEAALDNDLVIVNGKLLVRIVKDKYDLGNTERASCGRASEDDILGTQPAQHTNILFAKNPADGVRDIAFSATVWSDNSRDSLIELDDNPLGE